MQRKLNFRLLIMATPSGHNCIPNLNLEAVFLRDRSTATWWIIGFRLGAILRHSLGVGRDALDLLHLVRAGNR